MILLNKVCYLFLALTLGISMTTSSSEVTEPVRQTTFDLKKYSGNFISENREMKLRIEHKDSLLFARASGNPAFRIFPKQGHEFYGKKIEISLKFLVRADTVYGVSAERKGQKFEFKKQ